MPEWIQINSIEPRRTMRARPTWRRRMYKLDDFRPYLYKTTRLRQDVEEDRQRHSGERLHARGARRSRIARACWWRARRLGLYISFDDGENWKSFQLNLPVTPITDLQFHKREKELVIAHRGPLVLGPRRCADAVPAERLQRDRRCQAVPAEGYLSFRRRRRGEPRRGGRWARIRPAARWCITG